MAIYVPTEFFEQINKMLFLPQCGLRAGSQNPRLTHTGTGTVDVTDPPPHSTSGCILYKYIQEIGKKITKVTKEADLEWH